ncbi:MAG: YfiT family bacillithiol transferase [Leadbetterella sp.]
MQYPVGKWNLRTSHSKEDISALLTEILGLSQKYRLSTEKLSDEGLSKRYREGGWNIRQLVHHVADTHLFHYLRLKHALTEDKPIGVLGKINDWADMPDYIEGPIEDSLWMIESIHRKYVYLFERLLVDLYQKSYFHPVREIYVNLPQSLDMIVWHLKHHLAHIEIAKNTNS